MDTKEKEELRERYRKWTDEQLLRALEFESDGYLPEAVELMKEELRARNLPDVQAETVKVAIREKKEKEKKALGGWLLCLFTMRLPCLY